MPVERRLEALLEQQAERDVERGDERDGRRERGVELRLRLARPLPVEVEARRAARRGVAPPRRRRTCRGPAASSAPSASRRRRRRAPRRPSRTARRRGSRPRRRRRARPPSFAAAASAWTSATTPVDVSECTTQTAFAVALAQPRAHVVRVGRLAPRVAEVVDVRAVAAGHRRPALAEVAGRDDEMRLARRDEVLRRPTRTRRCPEAVKSSTSCSRAADLAQPREAALVDRPEVGAAVVDDRLAHRREHLRRHGRRARSEEVLLGHSPETSDASGRR